MFKSRLEPPYGGYVVNGLPFFCLERWQSLHETSVGVNMSESGVYPLTLGELERLGVSLDMDLPLGYGWTRGSPGLRKAIASLYNGVEPDNIVVTNGSAEANLVSLLALVSPGDVVVLDMPMYMQVRGLLEFRGARIIEVWRRPEESWRLPVERLEAAIEEARPRAVFINNPNNPTGSQTPRACLERLSSAASSVGTVIVVDEVYRGLELTGEPTPSIVDVAGVENAVAVGGMSKVYGLPGIRIGWLAASREVAERAWSIKDYTTIAPTILGDSIASQILSNPSIRVALEERARRVVSGNFETLEKLLENRPGLLEPRRPEAGAYTLARIPWTGDTMGLAEVLLEKYSILVVPGECFGIPGYLRIGLGEEPETFQANILRLLDALDSISREDKRQPTS